MREERVYIGDSKNDNCEDCNGSRTCNPPIINFYIDANFDLIMEASENSIEQFDFDIQNGDLTYNPQ